jgi:hypothetical protein
MPFLTGYIDDGRDARGLAARAARAFGADFVWRHPARPAGRTLSALDAAIYTEAPCPADRVDAAHGRPLRHRLPARARRAGCSSGRWRRQRRRRRGGS